MTEEQSKGLEERQEEQASGPRRIDVARRSGAEGDEQVAREDLDSELQTARAEIERLQDQSLRRQADLVNYRRRAQKEISESVDLGQSRVLEQLVPIIDDFERAVGVEADDVRTYHEGMQLILRTLHKMLDQLGVERFDPRGETFDPEVHEAIARQESQDVPEGRILDVYQSGYKLGDRLIRPAAVVVAYGAPGTEPDKAAEKPAAGSKEATADDSADTRGTETDDG